MSSSSVHLYMAGNGKVPQNTVKHISKLWSLVQDLSNDYEKYHKLSNQMISPPQPKTLALPPAAQIKVKEFRREASEFCAEKLNRRISKHLASFLVVNSSILPPTSIFATLQRLLPKLAQQSKLERPFQMDYVWDRLNKVHALSSEIFKCEPEICKKKKWNKPFRKIGTSRN